MNLDIQLKSLLDQLSNVIACDLPDTWQIASISSISHATEHDIVFVINRGDESVFDNEALVDQLSKSKAGLIVAEKKLLPNKAFLLVSDPLAALNCIAEIGLKNKQKMAANALIHPTAFVHQTAFVEKGAVVEEGCFIGAHSFIGINCKIGKRVFIHPSVNILDDCVIGDDSIIHAGAVIGSDGFGYQVNKNGIRKIPHLGIVNVGKDVEIGACCTIDRAVFDQTMLGDGVKLDNGVHIAHNVTIGAHTVILAHTAIAGSTIVGMGCQIGGHVLIKDHIALGNKVRVVSGSAIINNIKDGQTICGSPAIDFSQWKRIQVALRHVPEILTAYGKMKKNSTTQPTKKWWQRLLG